jgi:hypothetical protein
MTGRCPLLNINVAKQMRCAKHELKEAPQALVFLDKRIGKGQNQKSFEVTPKSWTL